MTEDVIRKIKEDGKFPVFRSEKILMTVTAISILFCDCAVIINAKKGLGSLIIVVLSLLFSLPFIYSLFQKKAVTYPSKLSLDDKVWVIEKICLETKYSIDDLFDEENYRQIGFYENSFFSRFTIYTARIVFDSEGYYINATRYATVPAYSAETIRDVIEKLKEYEAVLPS